MSGLGVAPQLVRDVIGITKAYCTRVGGGPFPTELHDATGEELRKAGNEFGATTGRPRRCGWIDLVALNYACMINGVTKVVMTKADVLDKFTPLQVCTAYNVNGVETGQIPFDLCKANIEPVLQSFPGWNTDTTVCKTENDLPETMRTYTQFINEKIGAPVKWVSNGPGRDQIVPL
jgi:Adenylosuccinate synthetase (EC 6.3.4.4)